MSLLKVRDVVLRFGGITALDHVSLELNRGEILGLIGPNGAGKTTLFNVISGVLEPDEGRISLDGQPLGGLQAHERVRRGIARTFQNLQLWPTMTVLENLKLPQDALTKRNILSDALGLPWSAHAERSANERARAILHVLDLLPYAEQLAGDLPVGLQRRVEIGRALAARPQLLLLDEPAAGLDAGETEHLASLLTTIRDRFKVSILLVDHDMSLVMRACHYIYVLDFGKLLAKGRPAEIRNDERVISAYLGEADPDEVVEEAPVAITRAGTSLESGSEASPQAAAPLLEVEGLAAAYGQIEVIRDVSFHVGHGEVVACIGANGAGKTTTLRAISGVLAPVRGTVRFDGQEIAGRKPEQIVRLGMVHVPQGRGLFPKLSVEDTLRLAAYSGHRGGDFTLAFDAFPKLRDRRRQLVGTLSGGEQQMVAMARALLVKPKLLLIDEMSQGLAPAVVQQLFGILQIFKAEGIAILLVEQFVDAALLVADRAYVFEHGTVAQEARASVLRADKALIASSYLGSAADADGTTVAEPPGRDQDAPVEVALLEEMKVRLPADLKRTLEERASRDGNTAAGLLAELIEGRERVAAVPRGAAAHANGRRRNPSSDSTTHPSKSPSTNSSEEGKQ